MRRALASVASFAGSCLLAPAIAEDVSPIVGPLLGALVGSAGVRMLFLAGQNLHPEDPPRKT